MSTALRQAGERGLEALSIRSVATELGISPMTIYKFVASKDELIDAMLVLALNRMEIPYSNAPDWQQRVIDVMVAWRELLLDHPSVVQLLVERRVPAHSEGLGRLAEHVLANLEDGGLTGRAAAQTFWQLFSLTFGHIVFERPRRNIDEEAQREAAQAMAATAQARGFARVANLAEDLTNLAVRGTLETSLRVLLDGLPSRGESQSVSQNAAARVQFGE
ncbi:TetR/AcrR family transcriptional regulator [Kribbella sp. VKM Ac-2569]|uniref:TetR/AcrR family transcriptional regulator n=1 Tax=Kribbella sp. VKM Ac-2569 TaxID=2512220 RepID=UPI00102B509B|nr:TetR/AcrR family transcriptional regulator [Kribbella sp. VKM Ac-2569]